MKKNKDNTKTNNNIDFCILAFKDADQSYKISIYPEYPKGCEKHNAGIYFNLSNKVNILIIGKGGKLSPPKRLPALSKRLFLLYIQKNKKMIDKSSFSIPYVKKVTLNTNEIERNFIISLMRKVLNVKPILIGFGLRKKGFKFDNKKTPMLKELASNIATYLVNENKDVPLINNLIYETSDFSKPMSELGYKFNFKK